MVIHRTLSFINGIVIGAILGISLLIQFNGPMIEMLAIIKTAGAGAFIGSIFAKYKWLSGISGGITGGLVAVVFALLGVPPVPGFEEWVAKYIIVAIIVPLLPTVGLS